MGTNYYLKTNICPSCGRAEEIHIGKSSGGWTFSFHGTETIRSYKDWIAVLEKPNQLIFDEYGDTVELDELKRLIEAKRCMPNNHAKLYPSGNWLDEEGNSFSSGEFI